MCDSELREAFELTIKSGNNNNNTPQNNRPRSTQQPGRGQSGGTVGRVGGTVGRGGGTVGRGGGTVGGDNSKRGGDNSNRSYSTGSQGNTNRPGGNRSGSHTVPPRVPDAGEGNYPVCMCAQQAMEFTVHKEGPNKGELIFRNCRYYVDNWVWGRK